MKALLYTHEFLPFLGALAITSYKLGKGISEVGLEVTVNAPQYSPQDKELDKKLNLRILRMGKFTGKELLKKAGIPGGSKEVIAHGESGYVVDGENINKIATCILDLLTEQGNAHMFGVSMRQRIGKFFTEEKMINRYLRVIKIN